MTDNTIDAFAQASAEPTFTQKALADYDAMFQRHKDGWIPPDMVKFGERAGVIIDQCIDRPVEEKEALKAFAILQFGVLFELDDTAPLATRYNEHLKQMADDQLQGRNTDDTLQLRMALDIVSMEQVIFEATDPASSKGFCDWYLNDAINKEMIDIRMEDFHETMEDQRCITHEPLLQKYLETLATYHGVLTELLGSGKLKNYPAPKP